MDNRKWQAAAVASPPDVEAAPDDGYPTDGDPSSAVPATVPGARWFHQIGEEVRKVIEDGGLTPDAADLTQLSTAIQSMIVSAQQAVIINEAVFEASVADGDAVYWDAANNHFAQAQADGTGNQVAAGIADVTNGKLYAFGSCPVLAGLTPGARYYLSPTTPGVITTVAPAANVVQIGIAKSATELFVDIDASSSASTAVGEVAYFPMSTAPTNFIKLNGAGVLVANYASLTAAVYVGDANNATAAAFYRADDSAGSVRNINGAYLILPDLRGEFIRGWDDGRGIDSGRLMGSFQNHALQQHRHPSSATASPSQQTVGSGGVGVSTAGSSTGDNNGNSATETRPRNIAFLACIRYQ